MKATMEDIINLHIESDSKSMKMGNKFILENEDIKSEYKKYLEKKYGRYKKEFDILNDFLLINPKIKINKCVLNNKTKIEEYKLYLNINDNINIEFKNSAITIKLENIKNFDILFHEYNVKDKTRKPEIRVRNTNKSNFELEDMIAHFFTIKLEKDSQNNLKKFFVSIFEIYTCIRKENANNNINSIFDKDLLNMKSEDIEFSMLANDYQVKPFLDDIKNIVSGNPIIKQSKKIK